MAEETDSDLRERVDQLEATVEQQQATIKKMLPGRRGALKAGGLLAGGGLLGALGSDQAAAADGTQDTSAGTIGAAGDSTDIYLDQLLDPDGDEILNVDDTGDINAAFGRTWDFDSVDLQNSSLTLDSLSTEKRLLTDGEISDSEDLITATELTGNALDLDVANLSEFDEIRIKGILTAAGDLTLTINNVTSSYNYFSDSTSGISSYTSESNFTLTDYIGRDSFEFVVQNIGKVSFADAKRPTISRNYDSSQINLGRESLVRGTLDSDEVDVSSLQLASSASSVDGFVFIVGNSGGV